jgi:hypothetical protein
VCASFPDVLWSAKESVLELLADGVRRDARDVEVSIANASARWTPFVASVRAGADVQGS